MKSISDALSAAVSTALTQPRQVPEAPEGWLQRAQFALDNDDPKQIKVEADLIRLSHAQYRADFDCLGWLFDLRNVLREQLPQKTFKLVAVIDA